MIFVLGMFVSASISADALSIRVLEGGVPVADYQSLVEEGLRLGNSELLRTAWNHYKDAIDFNEDESFASCSYLELGKIYFYLSLLNCSTDEDYNIAESYIRKALDEYPDEAEAHRALGLIFAGHGAYMDAYEELSLALRLNPTNSMVICDMASLHLALHQPDKTIEYLEKLNGKNNGWSQVVLAMAYSQKELNGRAYLALKRAENFGYKGYWVEKMKDTLKEKLGFKL